MRAYVITARPAEIPVTDGRGAVSGATIELGLPDGRTITGTAIPPEGDGLDCWLSPELVGPAGDGGRAVIDALARWAEECSHKAAGVYGETVELL